MNFDEWVENIRINLIGTAMCCKAVLPSMIEKKSGKDHQLLGGGAGYSRPNFSAYAVSKAGVVRLTEILADELKEYNIQVNADGSRNDQDQDAERDFRGRTGEVGAGFRASPKRAKEGFDSIDNAAELVCWLASENSHWLSGKLISAVWDPWREWKKNGPETSNRTCSRFVHILAQDRRTTRNCSLVACLR